MALDFPSNPTNGQVFDDYFWDASIGAWRGIGSPNNLGNQLGAVVARQYNPNVIINGAFDIWQRGTNNVVSTFASKTYIADRWWVQAPGNSGNYNSGQTSSIAGNTNSSMYFGRTSGVTSTSIVYMAQDIESINSRPLAGKTVTFSFYARRNTNFSSANNLLSVQVRSGTGTDQTMATGFTGTTNIINTSVTLTDTAQRFTFTGVVPENSNQLGVIFFYQPTGTAGTSDNLFITGVQLEEGSTPTQFRRNANSVQGELANCRRYYQTGGQVWWAGQVTTGNNYHVSSVLSPSMRVAPSMTTTRVGSFAFGLSNPPVNHSTNDGFDAYLNSTANDARGYYAFTWTANSEL